MKTDQRARLKAGAILQASPSPQECPTLLPLGTPGFESRRFPVSCTALRPVFDVRTNPESQQLAQGDTPRGAAGNRPMKKVCVSLAGGARGVSVVL